jgi:hypothetical protein
MYRLCVAYVCLMRVITYIVRDIIRVVNIRNPHNKKRRIIWHMNKRK